MKIYKILPVVTGLLLCSAQVMACDVYIDVTNATGNTLKNVRVKGPFSRYSDYHELKNTEHFVYHATGSTFPCHGSYWLNDSSGEGHCDMSGANENDNNLNMNSDGTGYFTILKAKSGSSCRVSATK